MKNKKIAINVIVIILIISVISVLISIIFNNKNINIEKQIADKEQLSELTSDNAYVTMASHLEEITQNKGIMVKTGITITATTNGYSTSGTATANLTSIENYKELVLYENLFPVANAGSFNYATWSDENYDLASTPITFSYNSSTGVLSVVTQAKGHGNFTMPFNIYVLQ